VERAFRGAVVRHEQPGVRGHDTNERDIGEVEPLRDHLRADQHVDVLLAKRTEHPFMGAAFGHRVGVHARDDGFGEVLSDHLF